MNDERPVFANIGRLILTLEEREKLTVLARRERRSAIEQAAYIVSRYLKGKRL